MRGATAEPFFVKNLENVQGDERDVIFISVGYGPDETGRITMNFGPLSNDGGERRLNVLITRARRRCEVFSSITDEHIDLNRARGRGAQVLKAFLEYARTGQLDAGATSERDFESPFEKAVADALKDKGFVVTPQVGVAGFFVDLAVSDPAKPGRFLVGIECDGDSYHSARSARDRDRLRQQVLEDQGWILHRIWSTDWYNRPDDELRKAISAIESARRELERRSKMAAANFCKTKADAGLLPVKREVSVTPTDEGAVGVASQEYREASFLVDSRTPIHEAALEKLINIVLQIVKIEQPIHVDEIARRVTLLWGQSRTGSRIREAVEKVVRVAAVSHRLEVNEAFCKLPGTRLEFVRRRESVASSTLRQPDMLPPEEIGFAIVSLIRASYGAHRDELCTVVARLLGFKSTSSQLRECLTEEINSLIERGVLVDRDGILSEAEPTEPATIKLRGMRNGTAPELMRLPWNS